MPVRDPSEPLRSSDPLGPLPRSTSFALRRRFHQAWYRAVILGIGRYGKARGGSGTPAGSSLHPADAAAGMNFIGTEAWFAYLRRRSEGWGLDPASCTRVMTSSQALTINMFGTLAANPQWARDTIAEATDRHDVAGVDFIGLEYAPRRRSLYTKDMTRIDALVSVKLRSGRRELIVVEVKYIDRFSSRQVAVTTPTYEQLAKVRPLWRDPSTTLADTGVNQLVRCHALGEALALRAPHLGMDASILVLYHPDDAVSPAVASSYRGQLLSPDRCVVQTLDQFIGAMERTAPTSKEARLAASCHLRYVRESSSETDWRLWLAVNRDT